MRRYGRYGLMLAMLALLLSNSWASERAARAATLDMVADRVLGQAVFTTANGPNPPTQSSLRRPSAAAIFAPTGRLFVSDTNNNRVMSWPSVSSFTSGLNADLVIGQAFFTSTGGINPPPTATSLKGPDGVATDATSLYVADTLNNRVMQYVGPFTPGVNGMAATHVIGQPGMTTGTAQALSDDSLLSPRGVAVDGAGRLFVADTGNNRVLRFPTPILIDQPVADQVFGQMGNFFTNGANQPVLSADSLRVPVGITFDSAGSLYIADNGNNRILRFDQPATTDTTADAVVGQPNFTVGGNSTTASTLASPTGLAVDSQGNLYVADTNNNRVLEFNGPVVNGVPANQVDGQPDFTQSSGNNGNAPINGLTAASLNVPTAVLVDATDNLYVVDKNNNRLLEYDGPVSPTPPKIASMSTNAVIAGGAAFTLSITGSNFISGTSIIQWNGANRVTTFVDATHLNGAITGNDIRNPVNATVRVNNGPPVGSSNTQFVVVTNAAPTLTTMTPSPAVAGGPNFNLTINGSGFSGQTQTYVNGNFRTTTYVSSTRVTAQVLAVDVASQNTSPGIPVFTLNPAPGGGQSATGNLPVDFAKPTITTMLPNPAQANQGPLMVTVNGTNFVSGQSFVTFNGVSHAADTVYVSNTRLTFVLTAQELATQVQVVRPVLVTNPAPGGASNPSNLTLALLTRRAYFVPLRK